MTLPDKTNFSPEDAPPDERLDRQVRIPGWNQEALAQARVGVVGEDPWFTGIFVTAAAALGLNRLTVVAPALDQRLLAAAKGLNPEFDLVFFPGYFSHFLLEELLTGCTVLVDLSRHALAAKLLLTFAHQEHLSLVRGYALAEDGGAGLRLFTYQKGREWRDLLQVLPQAQLPFPCQGDPVLTLVTAGLVLEETKKLLVGEAVTPEVISYVRATPDQTSPIHTQNRKPKTENPLAIVGAGALGNFVGLGLAALGFGPLTFIDPDPVEVTNLNRQILFWDAVGRPKAEALAQRLTAWFGVAARAETAYVTKNSDLSSFAAIFDCTDNHESRIILSEKCRAHGQILISGGTGVEAGQVVIFNPATGGPTPAELLGLYDLVGRRDIDVAERQRASCVYAPEPAVIMTNQIIGGLMVDAFRRLLGGDTPANLFYDARGARMLS
ncbi:MAG: HesA/MoeB/ThiF family protein [Thermodesulfobacteriota bacterium]